MTPTSVMSTQLLEEDCEQVLIVTCVVHPRGTSGVRPRFASTTMGGVTVESGHQRFDVATREQVYSLDSAVGNLVTCKNAAFLQPPT
jgi:hypothetical protein